MFIYLFIVCFNSNNFVTSAALAEVCALLSFILSLRFNGHFPGEPGLADVY